MVDEGDLEERVTAFGGGASFPAERLGHGHAAKTRAS